MFDKQNSIQTARNASAQGMVLLENSDNCLPLKKGEQVSFLGSKEYYRGGAGSAEVFCDYAITIEQGLKNKAEEGKLRLCENASKVIVSVARVSGEGDDWYAKKGQYYLTDEEIALFEELENSVAVKDIIVLLNIPTIMDMAWIKSYSKIKSVLIVWLPGMEGGNAVADILCGDITPSGHLTDTVAISYEDYPSSFEFEKKSNFYYYEEDIYVGYRYFETFKKDRVIYPFGYGLSYTSFEINKTDFTEKEDCIIVGALVKNTGNYNGAQVMQLYVNAPAGALNKPYVELKAFSKTKVLAPGEEQYVELCVEKKALASFDDTGVSGNIGAYVLEKGEYAFLLGDNVRDVKKCGSIIVAENTVTEQLSLKLSLPLDRIMNSKEEFSPLCEMKNSSAKPCMDKPKKKYLLRDVYEGKVDMKTFLAQLSVEELVDISSAQPPAFPRGTAGIGNNKKYGIPNAQTADGPAGLRKTVPTVCFPCATLLACSWDKEIVYEVGRRIGEEGLFFQIDVLLAPGLNIHRNPLCGRNFEYYSEDPVISGKIAAAFVNGVQSVGMLSTIKHFAANNKEVNRYHSSSQVTERALREIYLKGFEIAIKESNPAFIMTSYNLLNGTHTSAHYGLLTGVLREEWGYTGATMTDWRVDERQWREIKAGNNIKMPYGYPEEIALAHTMLEKGRLSKAELLQNAEYILNAVMRSDRFERNDMGQMFEITSKTVLKGTVFTGVNSTGVGEKESEYSEFGYVLGDTCKDKHQNDVFIYYDLSVEASGEYDISCRIATPFDSTWFDAWVDEKEVIKGIRPISANGWDDWHTVPLGKISLSKGEHRLKFFIRDTEAQKGVLFDYMLLERAK